MYMKFQKILMTGCRDMDKKHQKCPQNGFFSHLWPPKIFFKNRALSLLYPCGALTSCKKSEKSLELSLRYLKTDRPTDQRTDQRMDQEQGWLLRTPSGKSTVQYKNFLITCSQATLWQTQRQANGRMNGHVYFYRSTSLKINKNIVLYLKVPRPLFQNEYLKKVSSCQTVKRIKETSYLGYGAVYPSRQLWRIQRWPDFTEGGRCVTTW